MNKKHLSILLVEDSRTDAILIRKMLIEDTAHPCTIQTAPSIASALQLLGTAEFDVVLLDLSLPDTVEFSGLLSLHHTAPKLPIVILTAHADEELAFGAVRLGAQDYLYKDSATGPHLRRAMQYAIQRKSFEELLTTRANFDLLTGLANRALFDNRLELALARHKRTKAGVGVFFIDLDRFKQINDTLGHAAGDSVLQQMAARLERSIRSYDTAARFGGDEFAVLIEGVANMQDCIMVAQKIIRQAGEAFVVGDRPADVGVSIGIATCLRNDNTVAEIMLKQADEAMYAAKARPGSDYSFYGAVHNDPAEKNSGQAGNALAP